MRAITLLCVLSLTLSAAAKAVGPSSTAHLGRWRVVHDAPAPWNVSPTSPTGWLGRSLTLQPSAATGVIQCTGARYSVTALPPAMLFQGNLPAPANESAAQLGVGQSLTQGVSLQCSSGLYELHHVAPDTWLMAYDNRILTLSRTPGTQAAPASPAGQVQHLLELHFASDMALNPRNVADKQPWLTPALAKALVMYLATPPGNDQAPEIDGDPFTDTQTYPTRFAVGRPHRHGGTAMVPVRFDSENGSRTLTYLLRHTQGQWLLDDIAYTDRSNRLRCLLPRTAQYNDICSK